jgi:hypothetical protein
MRAQLIQLWQEEYLAEGSPATSDVVDTSELDGRDGLFKVLTVKIPLLIKSGDLYAESLVRYKTGARITLINDY